jgi:DNA repair protein RadA/Sms
MTAGVDFNRVALLVAVLEKRLGFALQHEDIFLNVAGGLRLSEPAVDLGIIAAISSSYKNRPIDSHTVVIGEVGLGGEIRSVPQLELRLREAAKLGFKRIVTPKDKKNQRFEGLEQIGVESVEEAIEVLF